MQELNTKAASWVSHDAVLHTYVLSLQLRVQQPLLHILIMVCALAFLRMKLISFPRNWSVVRMAMEECWPKWTALI